MDAILLCAGKGTRLRPLTDHIPKPLAPLAGTSPLERTLNMLPPQIDRIIILVGHLGHLIQKRIGPQSMGREIVYVTQSPLNGTGGALRQAETFIRSESFLVMNGDDLYDETDIRRLVNHPLALLTLEQRPNRPIDCWRVGADGWLRELDASVPGEPAFINIGAYALDRRWFDTEPVPVPGKEGEWSLPHAIPELIVRGHSVRSVPACFWMPVGTPQELECAEKILRLQAKTG